jgi:hypothetical protein
LSYGSTGSSASRTSTTSLLMSLSSSSTTADIRSVIYIAVNIYNYSRLVVIVTNNLTGLIFSRVGYRDLGICFSNKLGP